MHTRARVCVYVCVCVTKITRPQPRLDLISLVCTRQATRTIGDSDLCGCVPSCTRDVGLLLPPFVHLFPPLHDVLSAQAHETPRVIRQFHFHRWAEGSAVPTSGRAFLQLVDAVERWYEQTGYQPIAVHCM